MSCDKVENNSEYILQFHPVLANKGREGGFRQQVHNFVYFFKMLWLEGVCFLFQNFDFLPFF